MGGKRSFPAGASATGLRRFRPFAAAAGKGSVRPLRAIPGHVGGWADRLGSGHSAEIRRQWPAVCSSCLSKLGLPGLGAPAHPANSAVSDEPARIASKRAGFGGLAHFRVKMVSISSEPDDTVMERPLQDIRSRCSSRGLPHRRTEQERIMAVSVPTPSQLREIASEVGLDLTGQDRGAEGQHHVGRCFDDERIGDARRIHAGYRCDRCAARARCRWHHRRQGTLRSLLSVRRQPHQCHGICAQSPQDGLFRWRIVLWQRGAGGAHRGRHGPGWRSRWLDPHSFFILRYLRHETDAWAGALHRHHADRDLCRPHRPDAL
jgi:hypothetical protein